MQKYYVSIPKLLIGIMISAIAITSIIVLRQKISVFKIWHIQINSPNRIQQLAIKRVIQVFVLVSGGTEKIHQIRWSSFGMSIRRHTISGRSGLLCCHLVRIVFIAVTRKHHCFHINRAIRIFGHYGRLSCRRRQINAHFSQIQLRLETLVQLKNLHWRLIHHLNGILQFHLQPRRELSHQLAVISIGCGGRFTLHRIEQSLNGRHFHFMVGNPSQVFVQMSRQIGHEIWWMRTRRRPLMHRMTVERWQSHRAITRLAAVVCVAIEKIQIMIDCDVFI